MTYFLSILLFSSLFMIKGGWLGRIPLWAKIQTSLKNKDVSMVEVARNNTIDWLMDGTNLSALLLWVAASAAVPNFTTASLFAFTWWLFVMSSMGEESGAVGNYKGGWGPYVEHFDRQYGIKKALIHGIAGGALMAAATGFWPFMFAGATFPVVYFAGNSLYLLIHKSGSTAYSEIIYGVPFGVAAGLYLKEPI